MSKITVFSTTLHLEKIFNDKHFERLANLGELCIYDKPDYSDREYILDFIKDSGLIITAWGSPKIDNEILALCPNLRAIIHAGGAIKSLLDSDFFGRNIPISTSNGELAKGVAESTVAIMVAACKGMFTLPNELRNGLWSENRPKVKDFYHINIGIISAGAIGRHVIKLLHNYEVDILVYDPTLTTEQIAELGARKCELSELMAESDVISIHAPNIPATDNMINAENLPLVKDGAVIINTARPNSIDDDAMIAELSKNRFMAVIDVPPMEPLPLDHPYRQLPNVVLFPHIGGAVSNGCKRMGEFAVNEAERLFRGEELRGAVDLSRLSIMA
ncbi:MAG: hydroxyacid dehydrogenase [Oscillospiraceae bacterium]|nr:hydroxyacid dehydrogenase [Oscillospiraceae bacterium]